MLSLSELKELRVGDMLEVRAGSGTWQGHIKAIDPPLTPNQIGLKRGDSGACTMWYDLRDARLFLPHKTEG